MGKVMISGVAPQMKAPLTDILLSSLAEGSIVKLNENGSPVEFYVACHNYESALNGEGRTLLVRKDCYDERAWNSSNVNTYASCPLDIWFNDTYKALLDEDIQNVIGCTIFYHTVGNGSKRLTTTARAIFALSLTEMGKTSSNANTEGTALNIASTLQIAYLNGSAVTQWTRTPSFEGVRYAYAMSSNGSAITNSCSYNYGSRPAFTLPSTSLFDKDTLLFKGVS